MFCCILSPIRVRGGDKDDLAARSSLKMTTDRKKTQNTDMKPTINA